MNHVSICDTIKRNESDVRDVGLEILAKIVFKFILFHIDFSIAIFFITLSLDTQLYWGLH